MIEFGVQPVIECVATAAIGRCERRSRRSVRGICGALPIGKMAGGAGRREAKVVSGRRGLVALLALHHGVRAEKRKAVEVILNGLRGNLPAEHRVAARAIRAELAAVNVGVAIRAVFADVGKYRP